VDAARVAEVDLRERDGCEEGDRDGRRKSGGDVETGCDVEKLWTAGSNPVERKAVRIFFAADRLRSAR